MSVPVVKFSDKDPEFYKVVKERVNKYFKDNKLSKHATLGMKLKTVIITAIYTVPFVLILTGIVHGTWPVMGMWAIMGIGMSGIGLAIMHDANHGAYSNNQKVNNAVGFILNYIGGYPLNWKIQHNVLHHSFTNVDGFDEDIEKKGVMRFSPNQEKRGIFKFQILYAPILYGVLTIYWLLVKDFEQLVRYNKMGLLKAQGKTFNRALIEIIFHKTWYVGLTIILPLAVVDLPWWQILLGYGLMQFISGLILALIFQAAHVIEETKFFIADKNNSVDNNWAIHQMMTTANFGNGSKWFTWYIGGLNHQIEHHLFPHICHVHYPALKKIVKQTAHEFNVPYHEHKTWFGALKSHFKLLNNLGTGKYDSMVKA